MKIEKLNETSTSRIATHIKDREKWAIISPYRSERTVAENKQKMRELKSDVRNAGFGFTQFISRWVEDGESFDEESLLIPNMPREKALELGKKYDQSSIISKDGGKCEEVCTTAFIDYDGKENKVGDIVRTFNLSGDEYLNVEEAREIFERRKGGSASYPIKGHGTHRAFQLKEVFEVEQSRASYFQSGERYKKVF